MSAAAKTRRQSAPAPEIPAPSLAVPDQAEPENLDVERALAEPFAPWEIRWKPQKVSGNRCMAIAYINARAVMDRLDEVVGNCNWEDKYEPLPDGSVVCSLRIRTDYGQTVKCDVGSPGEQPDEGDRMKAAFSDALKRAAVKFGIGRYLYHLPRVWADYDSQKKQMKEIPSLPLWALPRPTLGRLLADLAEIGRTWEAFVNSGWPRKVTGVDLPEEPGLGSLGKESFWVLMDHLRSLKGEK